MTPRKQAIKNGDKTYEGWPCEEGHTTRYTVGHQCVKCTKNYYAKRFQTVEGKKENSRSRFRCKYGITEYDWLIMYEQQDGKCLISSCTFTGHDRWWDQGREGLCVDHCHKTGKIRGLLCAKCNRSAGKIENNIKLVHDQIKHVYNFMS